MAKQTFINEKPFCLNLQKNVNVVRYYQKNSAQKMVCYKQECEHRFDCKESTNCKHAFHSVGSEYLQG
ncbi:hypothetical protein [Pectinatus frisingensis]|jgi:hypothetical protein|uniref:hypothetical protein n=1 Tax=Pectinatus frisingensis TaxID=865 RepID=UPI0015F703BF|nr:hypothetical protein [Pectinatus frisingensis]